MATVAVPAPAPNYRIQGQKIAQQAGIPWNIFNAMIHQESGWNNNETSPAGAIGLGQLMPGTAAGLGVDPHDPIQNLTGAARYLAGMYSKFGSWDKALAAYNAGAGAVTHYGGIPPYQETQAYVRNVLAAAHAPASTADGTTAGQVPPLPGASTNPADLLGGSGTPVDSPALTLQKALAMATPNAQAVSALAPLGGLAAKAMQAASQPISIPGANAQPSDQSSQALPSTDTSSGGAAPQTDPYSPSPVVPVQSKLTGQVPMHTGGNVGAKYPNVRAQSQVDWSHVNPRLLHVIQQVAAKQGVVVVLNSGYRSNQYSSKTGGFAGDPHTRGIAVDAYINGHPIGDVIPPEEWAKYGVRSGNTPGFYHGKPDPEHLDLMGIPVKGGKK